MDDPDVVLYGIVSLALGSILLWSVIVRLILYGWIV